MPSKFNVHAGRLAEYVTIEQLTLTADVYGQQTESWATLSSNVAAEVIPAQGSEFNASQEQQSEVTHIVRIRYRSGISPAMRISYRSRTLQILAVLNKDERRRLLELHCREMAT